MSIEAWVTDPAGTYLAHLERSTASPFRAFAVSRLRAPNVGAGSLSYHLDNALVRSLPNLLADGNLVWMRYRNRTMVWVIESRAVFLDQGEHASDWVTVSGRGALQLLGDRLVFPTAFASGANLDPATWGKDAQWRRFTNRACGEMLWDLISESNPRFATQFTRGTVETTGGDGWTQDFRFDNLLELLGSVVAAYGDVDLDGLVFSYLNALGSDKSARLIFEEGIDLLVANEDHDQRDAVTWVVGEGVGEGVFAKLAVSQDATASRRREAYLEAKDAGNVPLLQVLVDAARAENGPRDSHHLELLEDRFAAFADFDLGDVVRAIAPSRGLDTLQSIEGIYLAEQDSPDKIAVALDLGEVRRDLALQERQRNGTTASSLGRLNRQPQGQLVPFSFSGSDIFDQTDTMDVFFNVPDRIYVLVEVACTLFFREFFTSATGAASSGTLTSDSGGGSTSGSSSSSTSDDEATHRHVSHVWESNTPPTGTSKKYGLHFDLGSSLDDIALTTTTSRDFYTGGGTAHNHGMAHTHSTPNHQHTVPGHTHALTYGIYKESYPASHSVSATVQKFVSGSWSTVHTFSGITADNETLDLTSYVDGPGLWRIRLQSATGQPNNGRIGCDCAGYALGAIKSA